MSFISYLINGISLGSVYAIIALGYTMVYGIAKMLNFAHGDIIMVGSYVVFITTHSMGMPVFLSVLLSVIVCTVLGIVIERVAYKPLRDASPLSVLITAIGVSTRPRAIEGSYMPCFLAGWSQASCLAQILGVPLYEFSHQQGHIAASLWSAGRLDLMQVPHLAWHLSGGTTELLLVTPGNKNVNAEKIGGTQDISAGQLIDRTGNTLGLRFPSGKEIDRLSRESVCRERFKVKLNSLTFSFSGLENKMHAFYDANHNPADTAKYVLNCVCSCIVAVTREALKQYPGFPVVFSGGVASNSQLRESCRDFDAIFAPPEYSTDNAMGIAVLTWLQGA